MRHTNPTVLLGLALWLAACLCGGDVLGADLYIYPNKGQSPEQQSAIAMTVIFGLFSRPASIRPEPGQRATVSAPSRGCLQGGCPWGGRGRRRRGDRR